MAIKYISVILHLLFSSETNVLDILEMFEIIYFRRIQKNKTENKQRRFLLKCQELNTRYSRKSEKESLLSIVYFSVICLEDQRVVQRTAACLGGWNNPL